MTPWVCAACQTRNYEPGRCTACGVEPVLIVDEIGIDNCGPGALLWCLAALAAVIVAALFGALA